MTKLGVSGLILYLLGPSTTWREVALAGLDVAVVSFLIYRALLLIRGTRATYVLAGLSLLGLGYLAAQWANLVTLHWLLGHFLSYSFILGVVVLFQADIRRGLAQLGRHSFLDLLTSDEGALPAGAVEAISGAAAAMARRRHGALLVIERQGDLSEVVESGVPLDAAPTAQLLQAIFVPGGPLHDGAVVVRRGRIAAARCMLPLAAAADRALGTRHRAALGLAEELDAVVVVVSEERGEVSLAVDGELHRGLDEAQLRALLAQLVAPPPRRGFVALLAGLFRAPSKGEGGARPPPEDRHAAL